jgi:hypothetical protein
MISENENTVRLKYHRWIGRSLLISQYQHEWSARRVSAMRTPPESKADGREWYTRKCQKKITTIAAGNMDTGGLR